jgi:hypothetical protein
MSTYPAPYELGQPLKQKYLPDNFDYEAADTRNRFKSQQPEMMAPSPQTEAPIVYMNAPTLKNTG